jgi:hypothetical protein
MKYRTRIYLSFVRSYLPRPIVALLPGLVMSRSRSLSWYERLAKTCRVVKVAPVQGMPSTILDNLTICEVHWLLTAAVLN